jgi:hypothetical protein
MKLLKQKRRVNNPSFLDFRTPPLFLFVSLSQNSFTYFGVAEVPKDGIRPPRPPLVTSVLSLS